MRQPNFPAAFFVENRKELFKDLKNDSLVLLQSAPESIRNADSLNEWRQDSNFFYFTGINTPHCSLLIVPDGKGNADQILFIPPIDPEKEKWMGKMLTREEAQEISGINKVQTSDTLPSTLFRAQKWRETLYCEVNDHFPDLALTPQHLLLADLQKRLPGLQQKKLNLITSPLRVRKKSVEIERIKDSIAIIKSALERAAKAIKPGVKEYQVEAEISYSYTCHGCKRHGFEPIVASGANATTLHYVRNDDTLKEGELVLIDTGGEYQMYSGDITRVFPVSGRFTDRQKHCYQAVLDVNKRFIESLQPGFSWNELHKSAGEITGEIYTAYGLLDDPQAYLTVSYHRIGHFLGLDIHDVGHPDAPMEAGTLITVEPGLYLPEEGIGIRIEDNVLLTETGCQVLSADIPKEIDEIEAMMLSRT